MEVGRWCRLVALVVGCSFSYSTWGHLLAPMEGGQYRNSDSQTGVSVVNFDGTSWKGQSRSGWPFVHDLQELLNMARKAEQRTMRLQKFKTKAAEQWQLYQQSLKDTWMKEHAKFLRDLERRERELQEATHDQNRAFQAVRHA